MRFRSPMAVAGALLACTALVTAACGSSDNTASTASSAGSGKGVKIALLLPESKTTRYESADKPYFEEKVAALCPSCEVIYANADQDAAKQQSQAEAAITQGAKALVVDPVDSTSAASIAQRAKQANVPVISYDRPILDAPIDYYISFDATQVGKLQGQSLVDTLKADGKQGPIIMINGSPQDSNAKLFKAGAHSAIDGSGLKVAKEYDTPDWSPDKAQSQMEQAITALGKNGFVGVYSANDGMAGGAVAAMKSAGVDPTKIPSTGQDAEDAGIQRILAGEQYMTVYKPIKQEAEAAAELAYAVAQGKQPPAGLVNDKTDNGAGQIPSVIIKPIAVTKDNIKDTVIKDGFTKASNVCVGQYAAACKEAGIE